MKRWILISCLVLIPALGVLVPAEAQASTVAGGRLTSGKPVTATISKAGQQIKYTFAATKNKHVTFQITKFNLKDDGSAGSAILYFYEPGTSGSNFYTDCGISGNTYCDFVTPVGGTWSVELVPGGASTGSLTLTFANDVPTKALTSGTPVTTTITFQGQDAGYTFAATANKHVTFQITSFDLIDSGSPGSAILYFYEPGTSGSNFYTDCGFSGNTTCDFVTPVSGTWSAELVPGGASTGSFTIELT
jgi:hypothetical protein